jgi:hypothetical protein
MNLARLAIGLAAAIALSAPAMAAPNTVNSMSNAMSKSSLTINMGQQNKSGQNGQAWVKDTPGGLWVKVAVKNEPRGASEPAHIHMGTCAKLNAPIKPLSNVVNGSSVTTVKGVTVAWLKKGHYAINAHQSAANLKHYVSCGDL